MKKILGMLAVLMLASQFSFAAKSSNTDAAIQRLVKVAKQRQVFLRPLLKVVGEEGTKPFSLHPHVQETLG